MAHIGKRESSKSGQILLCKQAWLLTKTISRRRQPKTNYTVLRRLSLPVVVLLDARRGGEKNTRYRVFKRLIRSDNKKKKRKEKEMHGSSKEGSTQREEIRIFLSPSLSSTVDMVRLVIKLVGRTWPTQAGAVEQRLIEQQQFRCTLIRIVDATETCFLSIPRGSGSYFCAQEALQPLPFPGSNCICPHRRPFLLLPFP